jgi:transcriptional regulator with XRE-family HTH domain
MSETNELENDHLEHFIDKHVGQRLKHRRIVLGFTREKLGKHIGVSVQQIHKYETAMNRVSSSKLYSISQCLKVPINYFFEMLESSGLVSSSTLAEEADEYEANDISEREVVKLMQAYKKVKKQPVRKKIVELVEAISDEEVVENEAILATRT